MLDDEPGTTLDRLRACAARLRVLDDERRIELGRRNDLVVSARDEDRSWRSVANAAGISIARAVAIVAGE